MAVEEDDEDSEDNRPDYQLDSCAYLGGHIILERRLWMAMVHGQDTYYSPRHDGRCVLWMSVC